MLILTGQIYFENHLQVKQQIAGLNLCELEQVIVQLCRIVSDSEFNYTALHQRCQDWSILGVKYYARNAARSALQSSGIKIDSGSHTRRFIGGLKKFKLLDGETDPHDFLLEFSFPSQTF